VHTGHFGRALRAMAAQLACDRFIPEASSEALSLDHTRTALPTRVDF
jgi:hypothetical protein